MPMPIVTETVGPSDSWSFPRDTKRSPALLSATEGVRLRDILNLRVGCWSPAVYVESIREIEA
jgi:hypothetical protein